MTFGPKLHHKLPADPFLDLGTALGLLGSSLLLALLLVGTVVFF